MLALEQQGKAFFAYNVRGREDSKIVRERVAFCKHARSVLIQFDNRTFAAQRKWLQRHAEPYSMGDKWTASGSGGSKRIVARRARGAAGELVSDSSASIGLSFILSQARARVYMGAARRRGRAHSFVACCLSLCVVANTSPTIFRVRPRPSLFNLLTGARQGRPHLHVGLGRR